MHGVAGAHGPEQRRNGAAARPPIPVYSMKDLGLTETIPGFEIRRLEDGFAQAQQDVRQAHRHDYHMVSLVTRGRGRLSADFEEHAIRPPMLLHFAPGVVHGWKPERVPRGYTIRFDRRFFGADARDQAELVEMRIFCVHSGARVLFLSPRQESVFEQLARSMQREYQGRGMEHAAALRSYLRIWLIEARRIAEAQRPARWSDRGTLLTNCFLALLGENFRTLSAVSDYAARLRVTPSHLNETVRRTMRKTAGQLIRERVLLEAKRLLRHSELSVAEIAYHLNFEDPSYFARFFRKSAGQAPSDFRGQAQEQSDVA